jgi:hypothetical protein
VNTTVKSRLFLSSLVLVGLAMVAPHLGGPRLGGPRLGDAANQRDPARIVVRADRSLAPVSPLLFGQNYGPWMNTTDGYVADYREAGVTLLLWASLGLLAFALVTLGVLRRRLRRSR